MKRIVILTDYYPPCIPGATAGNRISAFARYLPEHGWQPIVVTRQCGCRPDDSARSNNIIVADGDDSWVERLPDSVDPIFIRVQCSPNPTFRSWLKLAARCNATSDENPASPGGQRHALYNWEDDNTAPTNRLAKGAVIARKIAGMALRLSADATNWRTQGQRVISLLHARLPVRLILSSAPSAVNHLTAAAMAKKLQLPFIYDFRDVIDRGWAGDVFGRLSLGLQMRRVRLASRDASYCIFVTRSEQLRGEKQVLCPNTAIIPNGFFSEEMEYAKSNSPGLSSECFTLRLVGTCYPQQGLSIFIAGLKQFIKSQQERPNIRFEYYGPSAKLVDAAVSQASISDFCHVSNSVPLWQSLQLIVSSHLLILLTTTTKQHGIPGAKLYEYLASERPVLAAGCDSEVARQLEAFGAGVEAQEPAGIREQLGHLYQKWQRGKPFHGCLAMERLVPFTRREGVSLLANLLSKIRNGEQ